MRFTTAATAPPRRHFGTHRLLHFLVGLYAAVWVVLAIAPVDRGDWLLENLLAVTFVLLLAGTYRRFPLSDLSYVLITVFMVLHAVGAHYTYAKVPLGFWIQDLWGFNRNHFDRFVHFGFGLFLGYPAYELFFRAAGVRSRRWALFCAALAITSLSGLFEMIESWVAQVVSPELGAAYLGTQGDEWDAQKDMTMATAGILVVVAGAALIAATNKRSAVAA